MRVLVAKPCSKGWQLFTLAKDLFSALTFDSLGDAQDYAASLGWQARRYV
jgi:hypothetical protein